MRVHGGSDAEAEVDARLSAVEKNMAAALAGSLPADLALRGSMELARRARMFLRALS